MKALRFRSSTTLDDGRAVREARFEPLVNLKLEAVCSLAMAARDAFTQFFAMDLSVDVFEPKVMPTGGSPAIFAGASVWRTRGSSADALIVFRPTDAQRLASFAFREPAPTELRALSAIEEQVLERIAREIAVLCAPLIGDISSFARTHADVDQYACATYFELRFGPPVEAVIGIALSADPSAEPAEPMAPASLASAELAVRAQLARTRISAREIARLAPGALIHFETKLAEPAVLFVQSTVIGRGHAGLQADNYAVSLIEGPTT